MMRPSSAAPLPAAVVLAAGTSSRFGRPKQLAHWRGETLVRRTTTLALDLGLTPVVVVLGAEADAVAAQLDALPCTTVHNPEFASGQASSVRVGLAKVLELRPDSPGCLFAPVDQPRLDREILATIVERWRRAPDRVVQPRADARPTSPTIFPSRLFPDLAGISGDRGGAQLLGESADRESPLAVDFTGEQARRLADFDDPQSFRRAESGPE